MKAFYGIRIQESCKDAPVGSDRFFHYYTVYKKEKNGAKWEYLANFPHTVKASEVHAYATGRDLWYLGLIEEKDLAS